MHGHNLDREIASLAADLAARFRAKRPLSAAAHADACRHMPGGNTRTVLHIDPFPILFRRGEGARLTDMDGLGYVDFLGEYTAGLFGHSEPLIRAAIDEAMADGWSFGGHNRWQAQLASLIAMRFPSIERLRFTNSGTEANLMAVSLACASTRRPSVLVFDGAYHGGLMSFAGGGNPVNAPYAFVVAPYNDIAAAEAAAERHRGMLAAILVEPMLGSGGAIPATPEFLAGLRRIADRHGAVLIFDEVMTSRLSGAGRQGQLGLIPDLTTLGKYIAGGMSFGAFGGKAALMDRFDPARPGHLPHAGTFNNNVVTMAAGVTVLTKLWTPAAAAAHSARGDRFRDRLNAAARGWSLPVQVTGLGSIMAVHFSAGPIRRAADLAGANAALRQIFFHDMIEAGIYLAPRGMVALSLPLTDADLDAFADAFDRFLRERGDLVAAAIEPKIEAA